jgi:hypothetical protein
MVEDTAFVFGPCVDITYREIPNPICAKCGKREGTETWTGGGGTNGYIHGCYAKYCRVCVLQEQLEYAKKAVERIPEIEKELKELLAKEQ